MGVFFWGFDSDVGGSEATLANLLNVEADRQPQRGDAVQDGPGIDANVEQGGHGHVAADAAETVEMSHTHRHFKLAVRPSAAGPRTTRLVLLSSCPEGAHHSEAALDKDLLPSSG